MHAPFHIRPATSHDVDSLAELGPRTFQEAFGALLPSEVIAERMAVAYEPLRLTKDLADPNQAWFVAEVEEGLVGFISLRAGQAPDCVITPLPMELQRLYVAQPWHGRGPGLALLSAGQKEARGRQHQSLWLQAWEANPRALAFYLKQGFVTVGTQVVVLAGRELLHLVMTKTL